MTLLARSDTMLAMRPRRLLLLSWALVGFGCGPSVNVSSRHDAIYGGTLDVGDPAVIALGTGGSGIYSMYCSGTLIAPSTVLTAAHCINAFGASPDEFVLFGTYADTSTRAVRVLEEFKDPLYDQAIHDFGLLRLATPVTDVEPVTLNDAPLQSSSVGWTIRYVGFGYTEFGEIGTKHEASYPIRDLDVGIIEAGATGMQTCGGDSGGPGFIIRPGETSSVQAGVTSYGDSECRQLGVGGRVDFGIEWIRTTMAAWEPARCAIDGRCVAGCLPIDQDCACQMDGRCTAECLSTPRDPDCPVHCVANGVCAVEACPHPDPDCVEEGSPCGGPTDCRARQCVNDAQHPDKYCSRTCTQDAECTAGFACSAGVCRFVQRPGVALLDLCSPNDFCVEGICTGPRGGITRCVTTCLVNGDCASGAACETGADQRRYCRPSNVAFKVVTVPVLSETLGPVERGHGCSTTGALAAWLLVVPLLRRRQRASKRSM